MSERLDIIGAGAFGTALAIALGNAGREVTLWGRNSAAIAHMREHRINAPYLPGAILPQNVHLTDRLSDLTASTVLITLPMQTLRQFLQKNSLAARVLVSASKGIDLETGQGAHEIIASQGTAIPAILSGPSFARELAQGLPTAVSFACADLKEGVRVQHLLSCASLRLYLSSDLVGVALGGAIKNVIAIAAGLAIGAGLGQNARAALITRGFVEMQRVAVSMGARAETLAGLSGFGDLILSCTSKQSRNYSYGIALGCGNLPSNQTTEGVATAKALAHQVDRLQIDAPLIRLVTDVLAGEIELEAAIARLRARPLRME